jgi:conjugative relaxase-like TrwC/TraI family protein
MMKPTALTARGTDAKSGAAVLDYLRAAELSQTEYYRDKNGIAISQSQWHGKGAAALSLSGNVDHEIMLHLAGGFAPDGKTKLVQNAGRKPTQVVKLNSKGEPMLHANGHVRMEWKGGQRVGVDCTFSAPKSVSLLFGMAHGEERDGIVEDMKAASRDALDFLEKQVETKRGKAGCIREDVGGLIISTHPHFGNRELEPQMHVHALVYQVALRQDGTYGAIENDQIMKNQMAAGAVFRMSLASRLAERGYGIEKIIDVDADGRETGKDNFRVAGLGKEICDQFSTRRKQILEHQAAHGGSANAACLATRKRKEEPAFDELDAMWKETFAKVREESPELLPRPEDLKGRVSISEERGDEKILERLHATRAYFQDRDILERLAIERVGTARPEDLPRLMQEFKERTGLVELLPKEAPSFYEQPGKDFLEPSWASPEMVEMERQIKEQALARQGDKSVQIDPQRIEEAAERFFKKSGFTPSGQQLGAAMHVARSGGTCVIQGYAGSGKTVSSAIWIDALKTEGREIFGASTSWDAAKKLEAETGVESFSTARLLMDLDRGATKFSNKSVLVLDEAGMIGTPTISRLQKYTDAAGGRLILMGDALQLQSIQAGGGMSIAAGAVGQARLDEIRRQKSKEDLETAALFYKVTEKEEKARTLDPSAKPDERARREHGTAIYDRLEERGQIVSADTGNEARSLAVRGFLDSSFPIDDRVMIAGLRTDVTVLAREIRSGLKEQGVIAAEEFIIKDSKALGRLTDLPLGVGDRFAFTERSKALGVVNGTRGTVEKISQKGDGTLDITARLRSTIEADHGREVTWNTKDYNSLAQDYAGTVHKSQGQSIADVHCVLDPAQTDQQLALVSFTRTKDRFTLYGSQDDLDAIRGGGKFAQTRMKENIGDLGIKPPAQIAAVPLPAKQLLADTPLGQAMLARREAERPRGISR